jgi:hypothetical protein
MTQPVKKRPRTLTDMWCMGVGRRHSADEGEVYCIVLYYAAGNVPYVSTSDVTNRRRGDESLGLNSYLKAALSFFSDLKLFLIL